MTLKRLEFSAVSCPVVATLGVVGEKWTLLVVREAFYGVRRFEDFFAAIGCARNILGDRLRKLIEQGVLTRVAYQEEGQRERFEYRLTDAGRDLAPVLFALMQWGDRWRPAKLGPPVVVHHRECDARVHVEIRCAKGHGPLGPRDTFPALGAPANAVGEFARSAKPRRGGARGEAPHVKAPGAVRRKARPAASPS